MLYLILALFIWSTSFVAAKYSYTMLAPVLMVQFRLFIVALIVLPLFAKRWKKVPKTQ